MDSLINFDASKAVKEFYAKQDAKKLSKSERESRNSKKLLPSGDPNPAWHPRPRGKHQKKFLEDGSINPKWKPPVHNHAKDLVIANEKLLSDSEKLNAREDSFILFEDIERAICLLHHPTTSTLKANALRLYELILMAAAKDTKPKLNTSPTLIDLAQQLICPNCGKESATSLYCSELCQQEAITVRYCRSIARDGQKCLNDDIQEGIGIRLLMLFGGGYPAKARKISPELREQILERDSSTCVICGTAATEIDHISSSSDDPSNLRSLCKTCNMDLAVNRASTVTLESDPELFEQLYQYAMGLAVRIASPNPTRICDDEIHWRSIQVHIRKVRTILRALRDAN